MEIKDIRHGSADAALAVMEKVGYEAGLDCMERLNAGRDLPPEYLAAMKPSFVYLAIYGEAGPAYMKVGVADNVKTRIKQHRTSCPLPLLHVFWTKTQHRMEAHMIEGRILRQLSADRLHGEWVRMQGPAREIVDSLARLASEACRRAVEFSEG